MRNIEFCSGFEGDFDGDETNNKPRHDEQAADNKPVYGPFVGEIIGVPHSALDNRPQETTEDPPSAWDTLA